MHHYIQHMWELDISNKLRVEHYNMLKKMVKKFIKLYTDDEDSVIAITAEDLKKDVDKIDRHDVTTVDLEIKTTIHVGIVADYDHLDPEGMPKPLYYDEMIKELI